MLDLQALDQKVSEVLAQETSESLKSWLAAKRAAAAQQPLAPKASFLWVSADTKTVILQRMGRAVKLITRLHRQPA